jgi:tetratricopeptide (TPR) repeat protein
MKRAVLAVLLLCMLPAQVLAEDIDLIIEKGLKQVQRGNLKGAYATFKEALVQDNRNARAAHALAQVSSFLELPDDAVFYYTAYLYLEADYLTDAEEILKARTKQERAMYKPATLKVQVEPADAEVTVDGIPMGKGTFELKVASNRDYVLESSYTDYENHKSSVILQPGEVKSVAIRLDKIIYKGKIKIKVLPSDSVKVFVDTKVAGISVKEIDTTEGKHLICFKKEGFDRWWRYVTVPRQGTVELEAKLREQSRPDESCEVFPTED